LPPPATQREFCRRLFRAATANTVDARNAVLDELADEAFQQKTSGTALTGTTVYGQSAAQFQMLAGWEPDDVIELVDAARAWAAESTVVAALALIDPGTTVTHFECGLER
jgi:hypothetical protein